jgi:nitrous oxide reductase accessory protein NosL
VKRLLPAFALLAALAAAAVPRAGAQEPAAKTVPCAECGMDAEIAGRFSARLVVGTETQYFCDIGELVAYLARVRPAAFEAAVHDLPSGEWVDARAAFFVIDKKAYETPMSWGVAAFRDRSAAPGTALGFDALREALR